MKQALALTAFVTFAALLAAAPAPAAADPSDPPAAMKAGKKLFEENCRLCHGLDRALAPPRDAALWAQIVKRMVAYGAPLNAEQRPLVVRYLAARSVFAAKCGRCHEITRVVGDAPGPPRDWKALAERMAGHQRDLEKAGKAAAGDAFTPEELADLAALLQVAIP